MSVSAPPQHLTITDRQARGAEARSRTPLDAHEGWTASAGRPDPVALLEQQNTTREPDLVPVRHGRMMVSPFTFYRGAAEIMAADLAGTPTAGSRRPAVRGRAPVELRGVRLAGAAAVVRPERLRRDVARPVRVRRQADGGQLHDRRAEQRLSSGRRTPGGARRRLPESDGRVRRDGDHGRLVRAPPGRHQGLRAVRWRRRQEEAGTQERPEPARRAKSRWRPDIRPTRPCGERRRHGQLAGLIETLRGGRRAAPHHQRSAGRSSPSANSAHGAGYEASRPGGGDPRTVPRLPRRPYDDRRKPWNDST